MTTAFNSRLVCLAIVLTGIILNSESMIYEYDYISYIRK